MHLGALDHAGEAGKLLLPVLHAAEISDLRRVILAEVLSRHQHRDAWRVRHYRIRRRAVRKCFSWHQFDIARNKPLVCLAWRHVRLWKPLERRVQQLSRAFVAEVFEQLVAEIVQSDLAIAIRILCRDFGQRLGYRPV